MLQQEIDLYQELVDICNANAAHIESKFSRQLAFSGFHKECYQKMFYENRHASRPPSVRELKDRIPALKEAYSAACGYYLNPRNKFRKSLDIQLGQWYEKALIMFLSTKGLTVRKKGFPFPDLEVCDSLGDVRAYLELKYIEAPFISADKKITVTYPYTSSRYDYEASLTLDTGKKLHDQREKITQIESNGIPVFFLWWFDCFHVKGLFAMPAREVFSFYDHTGDLHERRKREGDFETHQETRKIYPPMLEMITFAELLNSLLG